MVICRKSITFFPKFGLAELLMITLMIGPFITCELNTDPIAIGPYVKPGLGTYEAGSAVIIQFIA